MLKPSPQVNQIIRYALGLALNRHPVKLCAFVAQANHTHSVLVDSTDASALPDFHRDFHALVARALNAHYGRGESLWGSPGSYGNVEIHDVQTLVEQLLYLWTNPVKDGLVARPEDWEGVIFLPEDLGRDITVKRPEGAFFGGRRPNGHVPTYPAARAARLRTRKRTTKLGARVVEEPSPRRERDRSRLPDSVTFHIPLPPGFEHLPPKEVRDFLRRVLDERLAQIHRERERQGLRFMGVRAMRAQSPFATAGDTAPTFGRNPRVACVHPPTRIALLEGLQAWRRDYRAALLAWRAGDRGVVFPCGSYSLPRWHSAQVRSATGPPLAG